MNNGNKNRVMKRERTGNWNEGGLRMTRDEREEIKPIVEGPPKNGISPKFQPIDCSQKHSFKNNKGGEFSRREV